MKKVLLGMALVPTISYASYYACNGQGLDVQVTPPPFEMKIKGQGLNSIVSDVTLTDTFDSIFLGNTKNPPTTFRLTVKGAGFANAGESFESALMISSALGIKEVSGITCTRGDD